MTILKVVDDIENFHSLSEKFLPFQFVATALGFSSITPLTESGELGSKLVYNCVLKSKTGVQLDSNFKTCYSYKDSTKKKTSNLVNQ